MVHGNISSGVTGLEFDALPPEINSGRMYLGPGSAPLLTAAGAWDALSAQLSIAASGYTSVVSELTGVAWLGPTSMAMLAATTPFMSWLHQTADNAAEIAGQARAAAAAYELAFAMTVPPPVIATNRSLLLALVATNFLGQNTAAIATTEAHYAQMWLQDASAMYLYNESAALASTLPTFSEPPRTSNPAASTIQSTEAAETVSQQLQTALSSPLVQILEHIPNVTNSALSSANAVTSGRGIYVADMRLAVQESAQAESPFPVSPRLASIATSGGTAPSRVSAAWGSAGPVGKLSAPPSWFTAAPEVQRAATALTDATVTAAPVASADTAAGCGSVFSQSVLGTLSRDGPSPARAKSKPIIVRTPAAG